MEQLTEPLKVALANRLPSLLSQREVGPQNTIDDAHGITIHLFPSMR